MVTYFNRKDLVSFGSYLLSEKRKARLQDSYDEAIKEGQNPVTVEDKLKEVYHADIENWIHESQNEKDS